LIMSLLNASIYPALRTFKGSSPVLQTAVIAAIINFAAYGIVNLFHSGIHVETIVGYLTVATVVTICSFVANYLSMREDLRLPPEQNIPPPGDYPQL
jgi:ABC-type iron transport system FetAB permease component